MDIFQSAVRTLGDMVSGFLPKPKPVHSNGGTLANIAPQRIQQPQPLYKLGKNGSHDLNFERKEANYILDNPLVRHELRKQAAEEVSQQAASFYMTLDAYLRSQQYAKNMQMPLLPLKFS